MHTHLALALAATLLLGCRAPRPVALRPDVRFPPLPAAADSKGGTVLGVVADSALGFPVVSAVVYFTADTVVDVGFSAPLPDFPSDTTDRGGGFVLRGIPPGTHVLAVRDVGHLTHRQVVAVVAGVTDTVVVRLAGTLGIAP